MSNLIIRIYENYANDWFSLHAHDATTGQVNQSIDEYLMAMGIRSFDRKLSMTTTYKRTPSKGKQANQCFMTLCRCASPGQPVGWPIFVVETGVVESLPRLREDARWWFDNSNGEAPRVDNTPILIPIEMDEGRGQEESMPVFLFAAGLLPFAVHVYFSYSSFSLLPRVTYQ
ncbi:hypothetical protein N7454_009602 [Penicillium verhagenii]|nr:hypothetical protein N7454_009602 [Penicillium verhagenii]